MKKVTVVDYGLGNILSVTRALEKVDAEVAVVDSDAGIRSAERLVLPGVGAFADGMAGLRERGLIDPLREFARTERPFLGICLGMQMMMESAEEFGHHEGLGLVKGAVLEIPRVGADGKPHKVPHIGWSELMPREQNESIWRGSVLSGLRPGASVYFVHSFAVKPADSSHILAQADYHGIGVCAAVRAGALSGCQFHPEKSGENGLKILQSFLERR